MTMWQGTRTAPLKGNIAEPLCNSPVKDRIHSLKRSESTRRPTVERSRSTHGSVPALRRNSSDSRLKPCMADPMRTLQRSESTRRPTAESRPKEASAPIIHTRIPQAFQQVYIASNRGKDIEAMRPALTRTRSSMSNKFFTDERGQREPVRRANRTVSFGSIQGKLVENIARENRSSLWFSKDEYSAMRNEAINIATATRRVGPLKESSQISLRGLEQYIRSDDSKLEFAKKSVLEHHDIAMYSLASARAVNKARQLAEMDAIEAHFIQINISSRRSVNAKTVSKRKLLNP